jgi:hypothetical protein
MVTRRFLVLRRGVGAGALLVLSASCRGDGPGAPAEFPVRFGVSNSLQAPVTIAIDGVAYAILSGGKSTDLTVSSKSQWLTWNSAKPMDAQGVPIPDDIAEIRISLNGINRQLEITNVINYQTYITARILNFTDIAVSIGVYDGNSVSCASKLPAASGTGSGFTVMGYYKLLPATEIRAYRDPTNCIGPYIAWTASQIRDFAPRSGVLQLALETPP